MTAKILFLRACVEPDAEFADVDELVDYIRALSGGLPVKLAAVVVTAPDHNRGLQGVAVRLATTSEGLGYAILGDAPNALQRDTLGQALGGLRQELAA